MAVSRRSIPVFNYSFRLKKYKKHLIYLHGHHKEQPFNIVLNTKKEKLVWKKIRKPEKYEMARFRLDGYHDLGDACHFRGRIFTAPGEGFNLDLMINPNMTTAMLHSLTTRKDEIAQIPILQKMKTFAKHGRSHLKRGPVDDETFEKRMTICTGLSIEGEKIDEPCKHFKPKDDEERNGYCRGCTCPSWRVSALKNKARMASVSCPIGRW